MNDGPTAIASVDAMQMGGTGSTNSKGERAPTKWQLVLLVLLVLCGFAIAAVVVFVWRGKKTQNLERRVLDQLAGRPEAQPRPVLVDEDSERKPTRGEQPMPGGPYRPHPTQAHADALRGGPFVPSGGVGEGLGSATRMGGRMDMSSVDGSGVVGGRGSAVPAAAKGGDAIDNSTGETTSAELKRMLEDGKKVVVGFFSQGCGHCVKFKPAYQAAVRNNAALADAGKATILWVNADKEMELCRAFNIAGFPTVLKISKDAAPVPFNGPRTTDELLRFASS